MTRYVDLDADVEIVAGINLGELQSASDVLKIGVEFLKRPDEVITPVGVSLLTELTVGRVNILMPTLERSGLVSSVDGGYKLNK